MAKTKHIKVRDLKPSKDAKGGGGAGRQGAGLNTHGLSGAGANTHGLAGAGKNTHGRQGGGGHHG
jgi:hypothetical protein